MVPEDFGLERGSIEQIQGGDATRNAEIIREVLSGQSGPKMDVVLLNAAAGLVAGGKARFLREGIELARASITSGAALARLDGLVTLSQSLS